MKDHGFAWVKNVQTVICECREIRRGRNKGKLMVTQCRGRSDNGTINRGIKVVIPFDNMIEFPPETS